MVTLWTQETQTEIAAITNLKSNLSSKLDNILTAIENVRKILNECIERVSQAETLSTTEDKVLVLQAKVKTLMNKN